VWKIKIDDGKFVKKLTSFCKKTDLLILTDDRLVASTQLNQFDPAFPSSEQLIAVIGKKNR
jgi:hypothetical protein